MSYTPQTWVNGENGGTPLNATRLNYIEAGIKGAHDVIDSMGDFTEEEIAEICDLGAGVTEEDVVPIATDTMLGCVSVGDGLDVDANGKLRVARDLLWENASPTSEFAAQTIALDLSEYKSLLVEVVLNSFVENKYYKTFDIPVNNKNFIASYTDMFSLYSTDTTIFGRLFTPSTDGINIGLGYVRFHTDTSNTTSNSKIVPYRIYGIKGGVS